MSRSGALASANVDVDGLLERLGVRIGDRAEIRVRRRVVDEYIEAAVLCGKHVEHFGRDERAAHDLRERRVFERRQSLTVLAARVKTVVASVMRTMAVYRPSPNAS